VVAHFTVSEEAREDFAVCSAANASCLVSRGVWEFAFGEESAKAPANARGKANLLSGAGTFSKSFFTKPLLFFASFILTYN